VAIVILGNFFRDAIDTIVDTQFNLGMRGDVVVWMVDAVDAGAGRELARLPGVLEVEAGRRVAVRFSNGQYSEAGNIEGYPAQPRLQRIVDIDQRAMLPGSSGLVMTDRLSAKLGLKPGDTVTIEVRADRRQVRRVVLERTVANMMGLSAYMERDALNRLLGDGDLANNFSLRAAASAQPRLLQATQLLPRVAGAFSKATLLRNMQVLGFTRAEVSVLLLGELAMGIAVALPLGMLLGWAMVHGLVRMIRSDQFLFPVVIEPRTYAWAALCVVAAGVASALVVRRRIDRLDMVAALKTRE
jgi:putative ABC transport system permease protein